VSFVIDCADLLRGSFEKKLGTGTGVRAQQRQAGGKSRIVSLGPTGSIIQVRTASTQVSDRGE